MSAGTIAFIMSRSVLINYRVPNCDPRTLLMPAKIRSFDFSKVPQMRAFQL